MLCVTCLINKLLQYNTIQPFCGRGTQNTQKHLAEPQCGQITPSLAQSNLIYHYLQIIGGTQEYFQGT